MVEFFAEQKYWPEFVRGGGSPFQTGDHVAEAINRTGSTVQFDINFGIECKTSGARPLLLARIV